MENPYVILGIPQDASKIEIVKAQVKALRSKKYTPKEIASAQKELHNPARRLAVDFTYPVFPDLSGIQLIDTTTKVKHVDLNALDLDKYDSLK
jgi:hypothetical protein